MLSSGPSAVPLFVPSPGPDNVANVVPSLIAIAGSGFVPYIGPKAIQKNGPDVIPRKMPIPMSRVWLR